MNVAELMITKEQAFHLYSMRCLPVHPHIAETAKQLWDNKQRIILNMDFVNESIDEAIEQTHEHLKEHPEVLNHERSMGIFRFKGKNPTIVNIGKYMKEWLKGRPHEYVKVNGSCIYTGKDMENNPIRGFNVDYSGLEMYMAPTSVDLHLPTQVYKDLLKNIGIKDFLTKPIRDEYNLQDKGDMYTVPTQWYTKDQLGDRLLFSTNFVVAYSNKIVKELHK